jgi:hypothetical protein
MDTKSPKSLTADVARTDTLVEQSSPKKRPAEDDTSLDEMPKKKSATFSRPVRSDDFDFDYGTSSTTASDGSSFEDDQQHNNNNGVARTPPPKQHNKQHLRINPNLILCDADHDGGTIIQPSLELPRGLRRLFLALNAGERI